MEDFEEWYNAIMEEIKKLGALRNTVYPLPWRTTRGIRSHWLKKSTPEEVATAFTKQWDK